MTDRNYINYLALTEQQKAKADLFVYTLGSSLNDKIFIVIDNRVEALNSFVYQNRFTPGTHHQFCFNCRKAYPAEDSHPDDDCSQEYLTELDIEHWDKAKTFEGLMTLREQFESMAITSA
jgi:hypothetical protein